MAMMDPRNLVLVRRLAVEPETLTEAERGGAARVRAELRDKVIDGMLDRAARGSIDAAMMLHNLGVLPLDGPRGA